MNSQLVKVLKDVVYNTNIKALFLNYLSGVPLPLNNPYINLFQFQINECVSNGSSLKYEGYQIGEPWNGDIENAPILFLSSNPGYNFHEVSPRYYCDTKGNEWIIKGNKVLTLNDIIHIQATRIQESPNNGHGNSLCVPVYNGLPRSVPYWGNVRNRVEFLLPQELINYWQIIRKLSPMEYAREIMKYVVCMEIVPFRSTSDGILSQNLLNTCWNNFTATILGLSGASIFVLVGQKVLNTFANNLGLTQLNVHDLQQGRIVSCLIGAKNRAVVYAPFNLGSIQHFQKCLTQAAINELQGILYKHFLSSVLQKLSY